MNSPFFIKVVNNNVMADKYAVKQYIEKIGAKHVIGGRDFLIISQLNMPRISGNPIGMFFFERRAA